jgi:hypothetical protein
MPDVTQVLNAIEVGDRHAAHTLKTGWTPPSELKEPDFDPLRGREDFKKLLAEWEARSGPKAKPKD